MRTAPAAFLALVLASCSFHPADVASLKEKAAGGSKRAFRSLVAALADEDASRAGDARGAVLSLGSAAEPYLREALRSKDPALFEASAASLGNLRSQGAVPDLAAALAENRARRYAAAWALGEIGVPAAVRPLVNALDDADASVRKESVRALVKIGAPTIDSLLSFLKGRTGGAGQRGAIRVLGEVRAREALPLLFEVTGENRDAAVWAMGRIGDPAALEGLLAALEDSRWAVRREAAEALGCVEDARAVPALSKALDDTEAVVREWAARSLEVITGRPALYRSENGAMIPPYNLYR